VFAAIGAANGAANDAANSPLSTSARTLRPHLAVMPYTRSIMVVPFPFPHARGRDPRRHATAFPRDTLPAARSKNRWSICPRAQLSIDIEDMEEGGQGP
jgi:hypothetical protein